jgi:hypothetical protein
MATTYKIHTTEESQVEYDANTELNKDMGVVAYSLWVRHTLIDQEYPIFYQSQQPAWLSQDVDYHDNSQAQDLTNAFIEGVADLENESVGGGWGGVNVGCWNEMERVEQVIISLLRAHLHDEKQSRETIRFIEWCQRKSE